ncbi:hypothetical protein SAMN05444410_12241 [Hydrobacter penzbergensis]|uniref:Uncharacterized protein n=1 Tax=Hydrobacter penzbergensis TaxID=1235997 RepID=A0A8X8LH93_9BACT|nr:hypothetical protein SAMN05444410_12241 [Hydrobacter penzbergensis]
MATKKLNLEQRQFQETGKAYTLTFTRLYPILKRANPPEGNF